MDDAEVVKFGKHDGFKIRCQRWLEGSIPSFGTF